MVVGVVVGGYCFEVVVDEVGFEVDDCFVVGLVYVGEVVFFDVDDVFVGCWVVVVWEFFGEDFVDFCFVEFVVFFW